MSISKILFSFSGRIPRRTYWLAILGIWAALFTFAVVAGLIGRAMDGGHKSFDSTAMFLGIPLYVCALWSTLAVIVKRWHDRGKSGFWVLIWFIPVVGPFWTLIELGFLEGTQGANEFDEGHFSKNVLLADDDPSLSAVPIVGRQCVHCQQQIVSFIGAELCRACKEPLHLDCDREHMAAAHGGPAPTAYP
jgi:uncharacterized membrane protein YhaH (DUF805 family)